MRGPNVRPRSAPPRASRVRIAAALALAGLLASGCASFRAARLYQSGTAALERGEPAAAIADLESAAALRPEGSEIQNHLGLAYLEAGRTDDALRAFDRAVELDCDNQAAKSNLAVLQTRLGEQDDGG